MVKAPEPPSRLAITLERLWSTGRQRHSALGLVDHGFVVDMPVQRHWDWRVAFYLYLAGTSAGLIFLEVVLRWLEVIDRDTALVGMWVGLGMAVLSLVVLFDHLGPISRWNFYYAFRNPRSSWISRGTIVVTTLVGLRLVVLAPSVAGLGVLPWDEGSVAGDSLRVIVLLVALAFMAYSGLVLSSWNSIAFWNSPLLPALYVGYSFLGGMAAIPVISLVVGGSDTMETVGDELWPYLLSSLLGNGFALLLYVYGMSRAALPARESVRRLTRGKIGWSFWVGVVGLGLAVPAVIVAAEIAGWLGSGNTAVCILVMAAAAILVGGYILRDNILRVGVYGPPI